MTLALRNSGHETRARTRARRRSARLDLGGAPGSAAGADVSFRAADGTRLVGHLFGTGASRRARPSVAGACAVSARARLARPGPPPLPIDFRGSGLSQPRPGRPRTGSRPTWPRRRRCCVGSASGKVFLVGASMGGIASLVAGANVTPPVDGVVSLSAPRAASWAWTRSGPRRAARAGALSRRRGDDNAGYDFSEDARAMHAATAAADKRLEILPGRRTASASSPARPPRRRGPRWSNELPRGLHRSTPDASEPRPGCGSVPTGPGGTAAASRRSAARRRDCATRLRAGTEPDGPAGGRRLPQIVRPVVGELVEKIGGELHVVSPSVRRS